MKNHNNRYYRGASGAFIVFDISHRETFDHLQQWIGELIQQTDTSIPVIIVFFFPYSSQDWEQSGSNRSTKCFQGRSKGLCGTTQHGIHGNECTECNQYQ